VLVMMEFLQLAGTAGGLLGAFLVCLKKPCAGQAVWVVSNPCWMIYGRLSNNNYLFVLFTVYWVIALAGVYNHKSGEERS